MFETLQNLYANILAIFPEFLHPFISIGLAIFLVISILEVLKKNFIWLIVLILLLPASLPILKEVLAIAIKFIKYLLGTE